MNVVILALEDCTAIGPVGPMEILHKTNPLYNQIRGIAADEPFFKIQLVSLNKKVVKSAYGLPLHCHATIREIESADLVLVPAIDDDIEVNLEKNLKLVPWLQKMYKQGAELASVCTGAFLLAETGLLDGKQATTHWVASDLFRQKYPRVKLVPQKIIVDSGRICMCGGATAFLNLSLYLIEKFCGKDVALQASKVFLIDLNKPPQLAYSIFSTQKDHDDSAILDAQRYIEESSDRRVSVEEVAKVSAISKRNFVRRFKRATGNTPIEYIHRVKVEQVKRSLEGSTGSIENLVRDVGYEDLDNFRRIFKRFTGISPLEYKKKYQLESHLSY